MSLIKSVENFGDARRLILETIIQLRDGEIDINRGMAIAANMKVLNDNIQCEINVAKLSIIAHEKGYEFGRIKEMGKQLIGND